MSGHFYESEMLLQQGESYANDKPSCKSCQRYQPSFKHEYPSDEPLRRARLRSVAMSPDFSIISMERLPNMLKAIIMMTK